MKIGAVKFFLYLMLVVTASAHGQFTQPSRLNQNQASQASQLTQASGPQFSAKQILPDSVYQTSTYKISDSVSVVDHKFHFNIETKYGVFPVASIVMLEKRLSELRAIEEAARIGNQAVAVQGAWETVKQTPRGAGHLLFDPLGSLREFPRGFKNAAANFVDPVSRHAGSTAKRQLAANLGVDSETRNPVLKKMLDRLVARKFVGETATKMALSAAVPGLGTLSSMEDLHGKVASQTPHELLKAMDTQLTNLGAWPTVKNAFIQNTNWTLLEKLAYVQSYQQLAGIQHADVMLYLANSDTTEADILRRIVEIQILANLHSRSPVESVSEVGLPIAWLKDGQIVGVCSTDYLTSSTEVQQVAGGIRKQNPERAVKLISTGWVSPEAQQILDTNKITFVRQETAARMSILQPTATRR